MDLNNAIKNRHSVRRFTSKEPDWRDIIEAVNAARFAPMAGNNYTLKFILVSDAVKIQKIADASQQDFIKQVKYVVVVCSNPARTVNAYGKTGEIFARQQAGAAIQNFLLKITELGLSTCWIGYFAERQIKEALDIQDNIQVEAVFPIGYELEKSHGRKKEKIDLDGILRFNNYKNKKMKQPKKMDV